MSPRPKFTGVCRFCGCSSSAGPDEDACNLPSGGKCHWADFERTVCSMPPCMREWERERAKIKAERKEKERKRTPAEIHALMLQERKERRKKSRKGNAA